MRIDYWRWRRRRMCIVVDWIGALAGVCTQTRCLPAWHDGRTVPNGRTAFAALLSPVAGLPCTKHMYSPISIIHDALFVLSVFEMFAQHAGICARRACLQLSTTHTASHRTTSHASESNHVHLYRGYGLFALVRQQEVTERRPSIQHERIMCSAFPSLSADRSS